MQVLDTIMHADRALFQQSPCLAEAAVVVHLSSHLTVGSGLTADYTTCSLCPWMRRVLQHAGSSS